MKKSFSAMRTLFYCVLLILPWTATAGASVVSLPHPKGVTVQLEFTAGEIQGYEEVTLSHSGYDYPVMVLQAPGGPAGEYISAITSISVAGGSGDWLVTRSSSLDFSTRTLVTGSGYLDTHPTTFSVNSSTYYRVQYDFGYLYFTVRGGGTNGPVDEPDTALLKLHFKQRPLKNLKVIIDDTVHTTNQAGEVEIPTTGEATIQFVYLDGIELFSICVATEQKPFELFVKTAGGKITEGTLRAGNESTRITINKNINAFDFENTPEELIASAKRYVHIAEALEFYQDMGVAFDKSLKVVTFVNYPGRAAYLDNKIMITNALSVSTHGWSPFTEYHEFNHYAMHQMYGDVLWEEMLESPNHGGFANPTTTDSWMEGFAAFMAVVIANHYDKWWTDNPLERRPSFYPMAGSLDVNYKAWEKEGKAEEFAIAGFLWDFIDGDSMPPALAAEAEDFFNLFFSIYDHDGDGILTAEELYVGQIMDSYAKNPELDPVKWHHMIEMGKDMDAYFDLAPDMELFDAYDMDGDGFLDLEELKRMSDILNDDGSFVPYEWLKHYDNGDNRISRTEGASLLKGYAIVMDVSGGQEVSRREDVKRWVRDKRITDYIDANGIKPGKNEISAREFADNVLRAISQKDDDPMEWSFDVLWQDVLSKKHRDFSSVLDSLYIDDHAYMQALEEMFLLHGMYQRKSRGDGTYNAGEAYSDTNRNGRWDFGEPYIDYPYSWNVAEGDLFGSAPSNYQRIGRESTPYFRGNYVKAPMGEYVIAYLIKEGMRIKDVVGYTAYSDGMLYVPVPPGSLVTVSAGEEAVVFSSAAVEASFDEIIKRGYVTEIKNGQRTGSDKSGGSDDGGCFIKNIQEKPTS